MSAYAYSIDDNTFYCPQCFSPKMLEQDRFKSHYGACHEFIRCVRCKRAYIREKYWQTPEWRVAGNIEVMREAIFFDMTKGKTPLELLYEETVKMGILDGKTDSEDS